MLATALMRAQLRLLLSSNMLVTQAVGSGLVDVLLPCLTQGSLSLACATVEALMQITIAVQGKQAMVRGILVWHLASSIGRVHAILIISAKNMHCVPYRAAWKSHKFRLVEIIWNSASLKLRHSS